MAAPKNREAPTSPSAAGRGSCHRIDRIEEAIADLQRSRPLCCYDCGRRYEKGPDLHVGDEDWRRIAPHPDGGGVLCPNCMHDRFVALGVESGSVRTLFKSGPFCQYDMRTELEEARRKVGELEQLVCDFQAASMLEIGGDPDGITPRHIERHVTELRADSAAKDARIAELERQIEAWRPVVEAAREWSRDWRCFNLARGEQLSAAVDALRSAESAADQPGHAEPHPLERRLKVDGG